MTLAKYYESFNLKTWIANCNSEWVKYFEIDNDRPIDALILAIQFGDWTSTKILAPIQPDINARDSDRDWTALMVAVHENCFETVKLLIELGADVNLRGIQEPEEDFALNLASHGRNRRIFDYLLPLTAPDLQAVAIETMK